MHLNRRAILNEHIEDETRLRSKIWITFPALAANVLKEHPFGSKVIAILERDGGFFSAEDRLEYLKIPTAFNRPPSNNQLLH